MILVVLNFSNSVLILSIGVLWVSGLFFIIDIEFNFMVLFWS